jgi:branched-chain amino acid aminotransferase
MPIQARYILDQQEILGDRLTISIQNRALHYGDGIFESILLRNGRAIALNLHTQRMENGAKALGFTPIGPKFRAAIGQLVEKLLKGQDQIGFGRMRLTAFRQDGGRYNPSQDKYHLLGEIEPLEADPWQAQTPLSLCFAHDFPLVDGPLSHLKTLNALPYVLAARHATRHGFDDALLRHNNGELAELSASNLFACIDGHIHTPRLRSGCLPGTMRARVIAAAIKLGIPVLESSMQPSQLNSAQEIFATNAIRGLQEIASVAETRYRSQHFPIAARIRQQLLSHRD